MEDNIITFQCTKCKCEWEGLYVPLRCPNCESVFGIVTIPKEDKDK
jgi:predicted nucleic acid binding AN1-type Zn finger protein